MRKYTLIRDTLLSEADTIRKMYQEGKTTRQIGAHFGVSKHPIEDAMEIIGIERRKTRTKGDKPSPEYLSDAIFEQHKSLRQIARDLHCDVGAIRYWLKEYNIPLERLGYWQQRNAARGFTKPDKDTLYNLYIVERMSTRNIADLYNVGSKIIERTLAEFDIPKRRGGWNPKPFICSDGHQVRSTYELRVDEWLFEHNLPHEYEPRLPFNKKSLSDFLVGETYIEVFGVVGSKIYEARKQRKLAQYQENGCSLIQINVSDFDSRRSAWSRKLCALLE